MKRPTVIITPDVTIRQSLGVDRRVYELLATYADAVMEAGGLPLVAPYVEQAEDAEQLLRGAGGLLLTGGDFDVDPRLFNERPHPALGTLKPDRTQHELLLLRAALALRMPVLGVCGGMQLINVHLGGTLWQDLPSQRPGPTVHSQKFDRRRPGHKVTVSGGTRLHAAHGVDALEVNTSHHQAVKDVAPGFVASAVAEDGLVEAIEKPGDDFLVGVQWHPEQLMDAEPTPAPRAIYRALVDAARRHLEAAP